MDTSAIIATTSNFMKFVGEELANVKRRDLANVDSELLRLKRRTLSEKLEDFKSKLEDATRKEKAAVEADLVRRRLASSTVLYSQFGAIERDAATELERGTREYNRAIEEIALVESKVEIQNRRPWWKKVLPI